MRKFHRFMKTGLSILMAFVLLLGTFTGCAAQTKEPQAEIQIDADLNVGSRDLLTKTYEVVEVTPTPEPTEAPEAEDDPEASETTETSDAENLPEEDDPMAITSPEPTLPPEGTDCGAKLIALTFDDGPIAVTEEFVQALNELDVKCTFFMLGYLIESYPEAVKAMVEGGHQIGSHSYDHPNLSTSSNEKVFNQLSTTENLLNAIDGQSGHYIRCPYGSSNDYVKSIAYGPLIHWSVDTEDWSTRNADAVYSSIMNNAYDGCIILCHDIYDTTRAGALRAIPELKAAGYEFVTVEELLKRRGVEIVNGGTYYYGLNEGTNYPAGVVDLTFGSFGGSKKEPEYILPEPAQ